MAYFDTMKVPRVLILMHQVEAAHVGVGDRRALDRAGIVDHDIDAAEGRDRLLDRGLHLRLVAHVDHQRQGLAAGLGDLLGGGEDRARQLRDAASSVLAAIAMLAPSRAARSAIASPMPREAPVMKSVWLRSGMIG